MIFAALYTARACWSVLTERIVSSRGRSRISAGQSGGNESHVAALRGLPSAISYNSCPKLYTSVASTVCNSRSTVGCSSADGSDVTSLCELVHISHRPLLHGLLSPRTATLELTA